MREIPRSIDSEKALLGSILLDSSIIDKTSIIGKMFFLDDHRAIYMAMRGLGPSRLDIITLSEVLERKGSLKGINATLYLTELIQNTPMLQNWETYQNIIHDTYKRRRLIEEAQKLASAAMNEEQDINQVIAETMTNIVTSAEPLHGTSHIKDHAVNLYNIVEKRAKNPKNIYGLETGIIDFDKITHGMQKRETLILAGIPGSGKSILAFQIAVGMAEHDHPGCVYELEMSSEAVLRRKASAIIRIPADNMRSGFNMNDNWESFVKAIDILGNLPIYISDDTSWDTVQLRADLAQKKQQFGIEWFLIDYLDLLQAPGYDKYEKSEFLSEQLHAIAKDLDLSGLIINSLNKAGFGNAGMQNLSGSAKVSYNADQIVFIEIDTDNPQMVNLSWKKMREGDARRKMQMIMTGGIPELRCVAPEPEPIMQDYLID